MKNPNAVSLGSLGGKARAKNLTKEQRQEISRKGGLKKGENARNTPQEYYKRIDSKAEELFNKGIKSLSLIKQELPSWGSREIKEVWNQIQSLTK